MRTEPQTLTLPFSGRSVLVTGGAGFIGSHLVEALVAAGARVTVLDNLQAGTWENLRKTETRKLKTETGERGNREKPETGNLKSETRRPRPLACVEGDVRDAKCVETVLNDTKPEYVFHLAANASVPGSVDDPRYDFESNAGGTFNVLDACRNRPELQKVVIASSGAVYGEPTEFPITERSSAAPISPYGASKLCAETVARSMVLTYGVPVTIARIFNTYGPRMPRFVVFDFMRKLQQDPARLEILGTGSQVRDLNYVTDTVAGLLTLATHGIPGEAYNLASGGSHTVTEIAVLLLDVLGLAGRTRLSYTGESWPGDAQHWEVDVGKARTLGYQPSIGLSAGLERVATWFETAHGALPRGARSSS